MAAAPLMQSRDTVSQPVASTQRPGRIYHADDFAPGLQSRREPPLVAFAFPYREAESLTAPAPAGDEGLQPNGHADREAAARNSRPHGNGHSSELSTLEPSRPDTAAPQPDGDAPPKRQARKPQKPKGPPKPKVKAVSATPRSATDDAEPAVPSSDASVQQPDAEPPTTDAAAAVEPQKAAPLVLDGVQRDVEALSQCMACDICREVLLDPVHASTCMHCYCRDCIDAFLVLGGTSNACPVCQRADVATSLGRDPYKDNLKLDFVLASLIRKVRRRARGLPLAEVVSRSSHIKLIFRSTLPMAQARIYASVRAAHSGTRHQQEPHPQRVHYISLFALAHLQLLSLTDACVAGVPRPGRGCSMHSSTAAEALGPERSPGEPASQRCTRAHGALPQAAADGRPGRGRALRLGSR